MSKVDVGSVEQHIRSNMGGGMFLSYLEPKTGQPAGVALEQRVGRTSRSRRWFIGIWVLPSLQ